MNARCILFVDDDASGRELGAFNLEKAGYQVQLAATGEEALEQFAPERHDVVITDLRMPGIDGLQVMRVVKGRAPRTPVIVITAYGSVDTAVEAMKLGAYDFVGKPFNRDHLLLTVKRAIEQVEMHQELNALRLQSSVRRPIVSISAGMRRVLAIAQRVAGTDTTVLVTGETGTGKELVARSVHAGSARANGPFVAVNCAAIPAELIESELFGHEKGAFTGATRVRAGRFRQAQGGTILLDEIAELPLQLQGKLLRVLEESVVDVLGSDSPVEVDVRVVAATNHDLADRVRQGLFREDLLYRLNVMEVRIPPLRERTEDIEPLVRHFVREFAEGIEVQIPAELLVAMGSRPWPGNVRQLRNTCERLVILSEDGTLRVSDLPPEDSWRVAPSSISSKVDLSAWPPLPEEGFGLVDLEKRVIERVLSLKLGNVTQAAVYLRVPRHILTYRMAKYGIRRK
jgi:DNA-binding NtrC family response regulator